MLHPKSHFVTFSPKDIPSINIPVRKGSANLIRILDLPEIAPWIDIYTPLAPLVIYNSNRNSVNPLYNLFFVNYKRMFSRMRSRFWAVVFKLNSEPPRQQFRVKNGRSDLTLEKVFNVPFEYAGVTFSTKISVGSGDLLNELLKGG